ncbi:DNA replication/repair protein RecF [Thalassotalea sp. LPB0316]|uniref:DNA replication/repair protein RecF n=1 Tax=Thalassotalea sp. LPB0316 TaxID=2769490 RepID=UPI001866CB32|nr:DNA replication/repair protein RecF [Thalassotalea sp. LPB0316]QOL26393.1 DNA replication/repair protein RecF [Thalassotalea sp. LPB0316]
MSVIKLTTHNFRNLKPATITFNPDLNFIIGDNGSGKSSILEAIFYLGHGKSFRNAKLDSLVTFEQDYFIASIENNQRSRFGIKRDIKSGTSEIKVNGEKVSKLSDLAVNIAVQVITPESFKLFFGGPKERRRFFDLGMFHVKHSFASLWRDFAKLQKQRNALLKSYRSKSDFDYWDEQFVKLSEAIAELRKSYFMLLSEELSGWIKILLPELVEDINVQYYQGWPNKKSLIEVMTSNFVRDCQLGFTQYGAHKFDVRFLIGGKALDLKLSRGQQKLFLLALTFAQTKLIEKVERVKPILLIDDFGAELDINSRTALMNALSKIDCQSIITAIDEFSLEPMLQQEQQYKMFHVKHGEILEISK